MCLPMYAFINLLCFALLLMTCLCINKLTCYIKTSAMNHIHLLINCEHNLLYYIIYYNYINISSVNHKKNYP